MSKHFITGAARSVTNSVERLIELRKNHPEWDDRPSEKHSLANGCFARRAISPLPPFGACQRPDQPEMRAVVLSRTPDAIASPFTQRRFLNRWHEQRLPTPPIIRAQPVPDGMPGGSLARSSPRTPVNFTG